MWSPPGFRSTLFIFVLLIAGCGGGSSKTTPPAETAAPAKAPSQPGTSEVIGRAPAKAIVVLEPRGGSLPPPSDPKVMDQAGYTFYPALLLAQQGQRIEFRNSEDVLHNVRVAHSDTKEVIFNVATPPFGTYNHTFAKTGYYNVTCDIHPAMAANILITSSPYALVVDDTGSFALPGVPPGSYTLTAYIGSERIERVVEVAAPRTELTVP